MNSVLIYTDGACSGNPGPGGWGAIMVYGDKVKQISGGEKLTTNNRMELTAVLEALRELTRKVPVKVFSDSAYVINGMNIWVHNWRAKGWKRKGGAIENLDLWKELVELDDIYNIEWVKVKGHSGHPQNERADELARRAIP